MNRKIILITGATAGIGRITALHLARAGHHVIASGRAQSALDELRAEAAQESLRLDVVQLDVTRADSIASCATAVAQLTDGAGPDVVVNNAGYGTAAPVSEMSDADVRAQYETNVFGLLSVIRAFLPAMQARRSGRIINISSIGGKVTLPFFGPYNSTKYAVESLSDAMRVELKPFGIQVVLVEPGAIRTNFSSRSLKEAEAYHVESSPYAPALAAFRKMLDQVDRTSPGPLVVARAIQRAVEARRPRARYVAPFVGRLMLLTAAILPTWLIDWMFSRVMGLTQKKLGKPTSTETVRAERTESAA